VAIQFVLRVVMSVPPCMSMSSRLPPIAPYWDGGKTWFGYVTLPRAVSLFSAHPRHLVQGSLTRSLF
jgi:hypothetical protein